MRCILLLCTISVVAGFSFGKEPIPLDLANPPKMDPAAVYKLTVNVGKGIKPVELVFSATEPGAFEMKQADGSVIALDTETNHLNRIEVADYNLDGLQDLRILLWHGTGGSGYAYFHYDRKKFREWKRPQDLELSSFDFEKRMAYSGGRSGPLYSSKDYRIQNGDFLLVATERYDEAGSLRQGPYAKMIPREIKDADYIRIEETVKAGKVTRVRMFKQNPWEDDAQQIEIALPAKATR